MPKRQSQAVTLARVSSKSQEDGYSLDAQTKLIRGYCAKNKLDIEKEFRISETASKNERRKVFREMLSEMRKNKINHLVVEKTDRLTRNFKDAVIIDDWLESNENRRLHMVKESLIIHKYAKSDAKLMWNIFLAIAKKYTDNLREEAMKGWDEKLAQGWMPSTPPPGYKTVTENGRKIHVINEETGFIIEHAFKFYLQPDESISSTAVELELCGLTSSKGKPLTKSYVHKMLSNKFYVGTIQFNGKEYAGAQEPLIEKKLFDKVQRKLTRKTAPRAKKNFLFKSLVHCGMCGGVITWQTQKGHNYGTCHKKNSTCKGYRYPREDRLEEQVLYQLEKIIDPDHKTFCTLKSLLIQKSNPFDTADITAMKKQLTGQIRRIERMLNSLYDDKLLGIIDDNSYKKKSTELKTRISKIESRLQDLEKFISRIDNIDIRKSKHAIRKLYERCTISEKRMILQELFTLESDQGVINIGLKATP